MNLHNLPSALWWAELAGEDRARSKMWMEKARKRYDTEDIIAAVKLARYYHRQYRQNLRMAVSYLKKQNKALTMVSVPTSVLPVH
jgi:hypothetical protein